MVYIFIALIFYATAMLLAAAASRSMNTNLAAGITNLVSAVVPIAVAIPLFSKRVVAEHKFGFTMAILSGICIGIFALALSKSYSLHKVGIVLPIVYGGVILITAVASSIIFKEKLSAMEAAGLIVITLGLGIIVYARIIAK